MPTGTQLFSEKGGGFMKKFHVVVRGYVGVQVKAEHEDMAQAMIEAAVTEQKARKYGLKKKQLTAVSQMQNTSFEVFLDPETFLYKS
jgi:hypothetical protein